MGKVLELSDETYQQLVDLAQQQRTLEEMLRVCLATYEAARYERVHQQMIAEGLLAALPTRPLPPEGIVKLLRIIWSPGNSMYIPDVIATDLPFRRPAWSS